MKDWRKTAWSLSHGTFTAAVFAMLVKVGGDTGRDAHRLQQAAIIGLVFVLAVIIGHFSMAVGDEEERSPEADI